MRRSSPGSRPGEPRARSWFPPVATALVLALSLVTLSSSDGPRAHAAGPAAVDPLLQLLVDASAAPSPQAAPFTAPPAGRRAAGPAPAPVPVSDVDLLPILSELIALDRSGPEPLAGVLIETTASEAQLEASGAIVLGRVGEIVAARVPVSAIGSVASVTGVRRVEAARHVEPLNDAAQAASNASNVHEDFGVDGTGVVVGFIDTGIDIFHEDFRNPDGTTRIAALLDLTAGVGGTAYTRAQIDAELLAPGTAVPLRDTFGHGTHVAGSAAGDGSAANEDSAPAGTYAGIAPGATLVVVKAGEFGATTDAIVAGLDFIDEQADALGMPWVANLSLGGQIGPHDGTRLDERAIDALVGAGQPGKAVVVAAGNDGWFDLHASGTVAQGATEELVAEVPAGSGLAFVDVWYHGSDELGFGFVDPNGVGIPAPSPSFAPKPGQAVFCLDFLWCVGVTHTLPDTASGAGHIEVILFPDLRQATQGSTVLPGDWTFELYGADVLDGAFDAWASPGTEFLPPHLDGSMRVAMPGTARDAITVGAYVSREEFTSQAGMSSFDVGDEGELAAFSGDGPTRDGRLKPEITAPGSAVISSRSAAASHGGSVLAPGGLHYGSAGTSMATPFVTGTVALLLEANPALDAARIRELLTTHAAADDITGSTPNDNWGHGRLDVAAVLCEALGGSAPACNSLTVTKVVVNDDGGAATIGDFTLLVDGVPVESGVPSPIAAGAHTVSEEGEPALAYVATFSGDCTPAGKVTVPAGGDATCTLTNDDLPALVPPDAGWRLFRGTSEPPADWASRTFDDSAWEDAAGAVGYGVPALDTTLDDMQGAYTSAYVRGRFNIAATTAVDSLVLEIGFDDGFVVYLNGAEVARRNVSGAPAHDAVADSDVPSTTRAYIALDPGDLVKGENVLAVHALNRTISDPRFLVHPVLRAATRTVTPPPPTGGGGGGGGGGGAVVPAPTPSPSPTPTATPLAGPPSQPVIALLGFQARGVSLWVLVGGASTADLVARMAQSGADPLGCTVASLVSGDWVILIPGAADQRVNAAWTAAFPTGVPDGTPLWSRCR